MISVHIRCEEDPVVEASWVVASLYLQVLHALKTICSHVLSGFLVLLVVREDNFVVGCSRRGLKDVAGGRERWPYAVEGQSEGRKVVLK